MDSTFLSHPAVVTASRQFVCARLATYENPLENQFLKTLVRTGSGELENTVFAIFAPDAKDALVRSGRGPERLFRDGPDMAAKMTGYATKYPAKAGVAAPPLPTVESVSLGVVVAAADNLPLAVLVAPAGSDRAAFEATLATLAWSPEFLGRVTYAVATKADDLKAIPGAKFEPGVIVVQPEKFGRDASVLATAGGKAEWGHALRDATAKFRRDEKNQRNHLRAGAEAGVFYEPKTPVTDPMELRARERMKKP
jgi:hypothetical protein